MQTAKKIVPKLTIAVGVVFVLTILYILIRGAIVKVEVEEVKQGELVQAIYATGFVDADAIANLRSEVSGTVKYVGAKEGESVKKGDVIISFRERDFVIALQTAKAKLSEQTILLDDKKRTLQRRLRLFDEGAISQEQLDEAKRSYDQAQEIQKQRQLAVNRAQEDLDKTNILAPISGILTLQTVKLGDYIVQNTQVATILDTSSYNIVLEVDELDVPKLILHQDAIVAFDAIPEGRFNAKVLRVVPQTDLVTKTSKVYLKLTQSIASIQLGMTATANIIYNTQPNTILIKKAATLKEGKTYYVWKVVKDKLQKQTIETGASDLNSVEILAGLEIGDLVVTNPRENFKEDMQTEITSKTNKN